MDVDAEDVGVKGEVDHEPDVFDLGSMVESFLHYEPDQSTIDISTVVCDGMTGLIVNVASKFVLDRVCRYGKRRAFRPNLPAIAEAMRLTLAFNRAPKTMPSVRTSIDYAPLVGQTSVALYDSAQVVLVGSASPEQARLAAHAYAAIAMRRLGLSVAVRDFAVTNIVTRVIFAQRIDLRRMKAVLGDRCEWCDPLARTTKADDTDDSSSNKKKKKVKKNNKHYSAARVPSSLPGNKKMLFFASGAVLIIGAKTVQQVHLIMKEARALIERVMRASSAIVVADQSRELAVASGDAMWRTDVERANRTVRLLAAASGPSPFIPVGNQNKN